MLTLVATPIGRIDEITNRSLDLLKSCDLVICESTKVTSTLLKSYGITGKKYEVLSEHTEKEDLTILVDICSAQNVVLVSDCGTPSFCDPGFQLVKLCRNKNIPIQTSLGASSLMGLISLSSIKINEFLFRGFLPAENQTRELEWVKLKKNKSNIILMDTPYRLKKMIDECCLHLSDRKILITLNISQQDETILEGTPSQIKKNLKHEKAEFMILIYEQN